MTLFTAEDYEPLPPGLYVGKLLDVEPRESANGEYRRWSWEVLDGPEALFSGATVVLLLTRRQ
jgi:hypothetical protein